MDVYFAPIVPDTVASLREDLIEVSEEFGLRDRVPPSSAFCEVLVMYLPEDENAWQFIKRMKQICEIRVG